MITRRPMVFIMFCLLLTCGTSLAGQDDIRMIFSSGDEARISKDVTGDWQFNQGAETYALEKDTKGALVFKKGYQTLASGRFKGEKLDMTTGSGDAFLNLKVTADKIKFSEPGSSTPWELKIKSDKIKLVYGDVEYGKVKYYPETGKIKAKDRMGKTVAEIRDHSGLTAAPGAFLAENFPKDKAVFLALFLISHGK